MIKKGFVLFGILLLLQLAVVAQSGNAAKARIAIFAPFNLDSLFSPAGTYVPGKTVPAYAKPAIEFYEGVLLALDSLDKLGIPVEVKVFDTRSKTNSIYKVADNGSLKDVNLLIGAVSGAEYLDLAAVAKEHKIPFISASYPNDGGVKDNPYVVIVNPKLNTHLQVLYNYILKNNGTDNIVLFRRKNPTDDRVSDVYKALNAGTSGPVLNIKTVTLNTPLISKEIIAALDATRPNLLICGSLDDQYGRALIGLIAALPAEYQVTVVGMPTWENYPEFARQDVKKVPVVYTTSLYTRDSQDSAFVAEFKKSYGLATYTLPTEIAYRGFELTYLFANILNRDGGDVLRELDEKKYRVLTNFDFKPVYWNKAATSPDYYENKRVSILKQQNGEFTRVN